jgi:hypothetical protein
VESFVQLFAFEHAWDRFCSVGDVGAGVMDWTIRFFELGVSGAVAIEAEKFGWIHLPSALRLEPFGGIPIYPNSMEFGSNTNKEQMMSLA